MESTTTALDPAPAHWPAQRSAPPSAGLIDLEIVIPVYNEERCLAESVERLLARLVDFPFTTGVVIADNASTDGTLRVAHELAGRHAAVSVLHLDQKGRGRALRRAWLGSIATVVAYMDVDLSTDLDALLPLVAPLLSGHSDLAIGSRLARGSRVVRGPKREFISRSYNMIVRTALGVRFSDAQCGFKAMRTDVAAQLLPLVEDDGWFFDTELLTLAERAGLRIHEVPVDWVDDPDSRVDIVSTARDDLRGIARLMRGFATGRIPLQDVTTRSTLVEPERSLMQNLVRFAVVGVGSTALFGLLYWLFRDVMPAQAANIVALLLATFANTAVNRRFTFGIRGRDGALRHQLQGYVVLGIALLITSASLAVLHLVAAQPTRWVELAVLTAANLVATLVRFLLFRSWVFTR